MRGRSPKTVFIVSHTHWDREWYRTYHQFRANLTGVVRAVLDLLEDGRAFRHFLLDGQSIILEDYLAIHPEDEPRIARLVAAGALSVGPWYVLPDEFLVSAEATVRNLMLGHKVAGRVGPVQKVGYIPDSFGHIAQMPQILLGAGIDSFIYTRGNGDEIDELGSEYLWSAPDGSTVLSINQCGGYCNAGALGFTESGHASTRRDIDLGHAVEQVRELFIEMAERSQGDVYLLSNGCDHDPPQREFESVLAALREAFPDTEFKHAALKDYVQAVRDGGFAKQTYCGELVSGRLHHILSGVWSTRMYLKQSNDRAQSLLADYLEPISAYCHFTYGTPYHSGEIEYAWKLLLQNHPHDSICGCSIDEVHGDMIPRFNGAIQTAEEIIANQLETLVPLVARQREGDERTVIGVMNPLPQARTEVVDRLVVLNGNTRIDALHLTDEQGKDVPFKVVDRKYMERSWTVDYRRQLFGRRQIEEFHRYAAAAGDGLGGTTADKDRCDCLVTIQFVAANLPPLGHAVYYLREGSSTDTAGTAVPQTVVTVAEHQMENRFCRVTLHSNGTFDLFDKVTEANYPSLNLLEDTEDVGDEYDYAPCARSMTVTPDATLGQTRIVEDTGFRGRVETKFALPLPVSIAADRKQRSRELVDCTVTCRLGLSWSSSIVEIELLFDNRVSDHRLRATFPTPIETHTIVSDGHFYVNQRSIDRVDGEDWLQPPSRTTPQRDFSLLQDGSRGLAVLSRGLHEVEASRSTAGGKGLSLTLLRAVGWLSRGDFATRRFTNVGPSLPTPDAQCIGEHRFQYAVVPFGGDYIAADIKGISQHYRVPVVAVQGVEDQCVSGGGGFLQKKTDRTCISAIKKHEERDTLVIRLFNLTSAPVDEVLRLARYVRSSWRVNLLEERDHQLGQEGTAIFVSLKPHEIVTLELEF